MRSQLRSLAVVLAVLASGCSMLGEGSDIPSAGGLAVADEPNAANVGADVLARGGNAVDAVTAIYFALSVTYPVAAGLGGGGVCVVYDPGSSRAQSFEFLAREPLSGGAYAVPGNVSGFSRLQNTYGALPWQRDVAPAEGLAAAGFPISHALAVRLDSSKDIFRLDASLAAEFLDESGQVKPEGKPVASPPLAQTLAQIRALGSDAFYRGAIADQLVSYSAAQGGAISASDLAAYEPQQGAAASIRFADETVILPPSNIGAGKFAEALFRRLSTNGDIVRTDNLTSVVGAATKSTLDEFGIASLPRDLGATGFAAEDSKGMAAACAVTMNGPFGSGHTAAGTGVTLANSPSTGNTGLASAFLNPVVATNGGTVSLTGSGAGGPNGTAGIARDLLRLARGEDITKPGELHTTGIAPYDTVNVIGCRSGICSAIPDPGAFGLGAAATQ